VLVGRAGQPLTVLSDREADLRKPLLEPAADLFRAGRAGETDADAAALVSTVLAARHVHRVDRRAGVEVDAVEVEVGCVELDLGQLDLAGEAGDVDLHLTRLGIHRAQHIAAVGVDRHRGAVARPVAAGKRQGDGGGGEKQAFHRHDPLAC